MYRIEVWMNRPFMDIEYIAVYDHEGRRIDEFGYFRSGLWLSGVMMVPIPANQDSRMHLNVLVNALSAGLQRVSCSFRPRIAPQNEPRSVNGRTVRAESRERAREQFPLSRVFHTIIDVYEGAK